MEAVVDAYNSGERAMGWYYYLDSKLKFPFKARCRLVRSISSLRVGEEVQVLGMAPEEECESEMFVWIARAGVLNRRSIGATATIIERSRHPGRCWRLALTAPVPSTTPSSVAAIQRITGCRTQL